MKKLTLRGLAFAGLILAVLGLSLAQAPPPTTPPLSYAVAYDLKAKTWTPIAAYRIATFEDFAGKKGFNLDLCGVAGLDLQSTQPMGGVAVFWNRPMAKNLDIGFGFGATVQANRPTGVFIAITAVVRF